MGQPRRRGTLNVFPASAASRWLLACALALHLCACLGPSAILEPANERAFKFGRDTFAFKNELQWIYHAGVSVYAGGVKERNPDAEYVLHCFVLSRSARQFFQFARFDPAAKQIDDHGYTELIRKVIALDPSQRAPATDRVVIPGYPDLHSFSKARESILKSELGSAANSFLQRGNWRMIFPFSHDHQEETAKSLLAEIRIDRPPVVHLVVFPELTINHAVLLYGAREERNRIVFKVYDPNSSSSPALLTYDRRTRTFDFPRADYFVGGMVDVYEVYKSVIY